MKIDRCELVKREHLILDHNFIEPIWNVWLDRILESLPDKSYVTKDWLPSLRAPLQKANELIEYWLAAGEITEEDLE